MIDVGILVIIMGLAAIAIGSYIHLYLEHSLYAYSCDGIVSFNKFLEIYECSSNKIQLNDRYFTYSYYDEGNFNGVTYDFYFSIHDTFRYEQWRKKLERMENEARSEKLMSQMEELWAEDARKSQNTH